MFSPAFSVAGGGPVYRMEKTPDVFKGICTVRASTADGTATRPNGIKRQGQRYGARKARFITTQTCENQQWKGKDKGIKAGGGSNLPPIPLPCICVKERCLLNINLLSPTGVGNGEAVKERVCDLHRELARCKRQTQKSGKVPRLALWNQFWKHWNRCPNL